MNDEPRAPTGLDEVPPGFAVPGDRVRLSPDELSERLATGDLKDVDLFDEARLMPEQLAGADLAGARLPDHLAGFDGLKQVEEISKIARAIFIGLLAACLYSWLTIGAATDAALIANTASSPLPIINTNIPIANFFVVGAAILAAVYCYFHFYLLRLWRALAGLPAIFPDGKPLDDHAYPWLLTSLARAWMPRLAGARRPLAHLEHLVTVGLAWGVVPLTLFLYWRRYLPGHYPWGTALLVVFLMLALLFGMRTYRLARQMLRHRGEADAIASGGEGGLLPRSLRQLAELRPNRLTGVLGTALVVASFSALRDDPDAPHTWVAKALNAVGMRTTADLTEVDLAQKPDGWDGEDLGRIKRVDLRGRNLAFATAGQAFLANADLRGANLQGANLRRADLQGADLRGANLQGANLERADLRGADLRGANLQGAYLPGAHLQGAYLRRADLQGARLGRADLQGAHLWDANLQGAHLGGANLQGAHLVGADLQGADLGRADLQGANLQGADLLGAYLRGANLQGAYLGDANLQGADLWRADLQGADLQFASLQGANLRGAALWRAWLGDDPERDKLWSLADLSGAHADPLADVDVWIAEALEGIGDDVRGKVAGLLREALVESDRPAVPSWSGQPRVWFEQVPEGFDWTLGDRPWAEVDGYRQELADFLGNLACAPDTPRALTGGLADRAFRGDMPLLAARIVGGDCPPAAALPDHLRRWLEITAAELGS